MKRGARLNGIYEIETLIAQGGMGEVYKGFNIQTNDPVAIKMILPELARNPEAFALVPRRSLDAAQSAARSDRPLFRFLGRSRQLQRAYLAMEFVDGPSLTKRLSQGPLNATEAAILRRRIAGALGGGASFWRRPPRHFIRQYHSARQRCSPRENHRFRHRALAASRRRHADRQRIRRQISITFRPSSLGLAGGDVTAKSDIYSFGLVLAEALRGRPIDMNGTQVEIIEKRRAAPDLSDMPSPIRPLLQAMLQPLPADRPDMAEVAAWSEGDAAALKLPRVAPLGLGGGISAPASGAAAAPRGSSGGRIAAAVGALLVIVGVGATLYVFRDVLPWNGSTVGLSGSNSSASGGQAQDVASQPGATHKLPPLPSLPSSQTDVSGVGAGSKPSATTTTEVKTPASTPHVPSADEIVQSLNQAKPQKPDKVASNPANGGEVHTETDSAPPAKPAPAPIAPTNADADIKKNKPPQSSTPTPPPPTPHMASVAPAPEVAPTPTAAPIVPVAPPAPVPPPRASQNVLTMADATVGKDYVADLPPFSDAGGAKSLVLHAEPNPPDGLTFADLGSGLSQISGKPSKAGRYSFEIVAANAAGITAHMTTRLTIAPQPMEPPAAPVAASEPSAPPAEPASKPITIGAIEPPPPLPVTPPEPAKPVVASLSPADQAAAFVRGFDGGSCFLARPYGAGSNGIAIEGIGSDEATFRRFYDNFKSDVGIEPALTVRLIGSAECPAIDLIRSGGSEPPNIRLTGYDVGRGKPLAGTVSNLGGRRLDLLLVASDGKVYRLDSRVLPGGGSATFSVPMTPDTASINALQIVLAVVSPKPVHALEGLKAASAAEILPRLREELAAADGALEVDFFRLVK